MDRVELRTRKFGRQVYLFSVGVLGALLVELLTENGIQHSAALRAGSGHEGLFAYLNDRLYLPAALISVIAIWRFIKKQRMPEPFELGGVLIVVALVASFGHLL